MELDGPVELMEPTEGPEEEPAEAPTGETGSSEDGCKFHPKSVTEQICLTDYLYPHSGRGRRINTSLPL